MTKSTIEHPKVVSRAEWLGARKTLLAKEKELTRYRDAVNAERRRLPMVKIEKDYVFDAPGGKKSLGELFADKSQLMVYHFMFGPDWEEGCRSCSLVSDHIDGQLASPAARRAPVGRLSCASCQDREIQEAHGLALRVGVFPRQRLQLRLWCIVPERGRGKGQGELQL